jgi:hypothetical protein
MAVRVYLYAGYLPNFLLFESPLQTERGEFLESPSPLERGRLKRETNSPAPERVCYSIGLKSKYQRYVTI